MLRWELVILRWKIKLRYRAQDIQDLRKHPVLLWDRAEKWQWFAVLFIGAISVLAIGEYGFGLLLLFLSGLSVASKIQHWSGVSSKLWTRTLKIGGISAAIGVFVLCLFTAMAVKGNGPWSHLPQGWERMIAFIRTQPSAVAPEIDWEAISRLDPRPMNMPLVPLQPLPLFRVVTPKAPNTPCTMKGGTYYSTVLSLPGGPNLNRPLFELEGSYKTAWYWEGDQYWLLLEVALTNRGEASIAKDWELCLEQEHKPVMFEPRDIPRQGIVLVDGERITQDDMLMDTAVKEQVGHGHLMSGWVAFSIPKTLGETLKDNPKLPNGALRFKDYLAHTYSYDFVGRDRPIPNVYVPGRN